MRRLGAAALVLFLAACSRADVTTEGDEPASPTAVSCPSASTSDVVPCDQAITIANAQTGFWDRGNVKVRSSTAKAASGAEVPVWIVTYPDVPLVRFGAGGGCGVADYSVSIASTDGSTVASGPTEVVSKNPCVVEATADTMQLPPGNARRTLSPGTVQGFRSIDQIMTAGQSDEWLPAPVHIWSGRFNQQGKTPNDTYRNHPAYVLEYNHGSRTCGAEASATPAADPAATDCRSWMTYDAIDGALLSVAG